MGFPIFSGKVVGARRAMGDYSAIVKKQENDVWAENEYGELIADGEAGVDDAEVIQKAIDYAQTVKGKVSCKGEFNIDQTIYARGGVTLDLIEATIKPTADVDIFYIEKDTKVFGGVIDVTGITYTSRVFTISGAEQFGTKDHNTTIRDVRIKNNAKTGIAFYLVADGASGQQFINWITIDNIQIEEFEYGFLLETFGTYGDAWINGNNFLNIKSRYTKYLFYLKQNNDAEISGNFISGFEYQSPTDGSTVVKVIYCDGKYNYFNGKIWDLHLAGSGSVSAEFSSTSEDNILIGTVWSNYIVDNGTNNQIIDNLHNLIRFPYIESLDLRSISGNSFYIKTRDSAGNLVIRLEIPDGADRPPVTFSGNNVSAIRAAGTSTNVPPRFESFVPAEQVGTGIAAFCVKVRDEEKYRFYIATDGTIKWGDGTSYDVSLYRSEADLLKTDDYFQASLGIITKVDVDDYGGNFANYTPPTGKEGLIVIAIDTNATNPGKRLYVYANGEWHYVDLS